MATPDPAKDFPLYRTMTPAGWLVVLLCCAAGFAALVGSPTLVAGPLGHWTGVLLFPLIPLLGLRLVAGRGWTVLVARPQLRDLAIGLAFVPLVILLSFGTALVVNNFGETVSNPVNQLLSAMGPGEVAAFLAGTLPQLFGEEVVTILPLLAVLGILHHHLGVGRRTSLIAASAISALVFGALHLPTYDWHVMQALVVIPVARLVLTLPYIITRNIWASTLAHVVNDWTLFAAPFLLASLLR